MSTSAMSVADPKKPVTNGQITMIASAIEELSKTNAEIPGTNRQKFTAAYVRNFDTDLRPLCDQALERPDGVLYAACMHLNGYSATHNDKYSKPLSRNYEVDVVQSRDKRIFNDEKGKRAAANIDPLPPPDVYYGSRRGGQRPVDTGDRIGWDPAGSHAEGLTDSCGSS